jgi:hypothetical protein
MTKARAKDMPDHPGSTVDGFVIRLGGHSILTICRSLGIGRKKRPFGLSSIDPKNAKYTSQWRLFATGSLVGSLQLPFLRHALHRL